MSVTTTSEKVRELEKKVELEMELLPLLSAAKILRMTSELEESDSDEVKLKKLRQRMKLVEDAKVTMWVVALCFTSIALVAGSALLWHVLKQLL